MICAECRVALAEYAESIKQARAEYVVAITPGYETYTRVVVGCGCNHESLLWCDRCSAAYDEYRKEREKHGAIFATLTALPWAKLRETRGCCCGISPLALSLLDDEGGRL